MREILYFLEYNEKMLCLGIIRVVHCHTNRLIIQQWVYRYGQSLHVFIIVSRRACRRIRQAVLYVKERAVPITNRERQKRQFPKNLAKKNIFFN